VKEIKLRIDDKVYRDLKSHLMVKKIACSLGGVADSAWGKVVTSIENNKEEVLLKYKKDRK
tara:strand:- start:673 stop:855 length:183 start_codon:yes stop_codon:yes gene_type:complete